MKTAGFSLLEMVVALAISGILMLSLGRFLPLLQQESLRLQQRVQLQRELQQIMMTLEKAVRRAGYCHGHCVGSGLTIAAQGACLLVKWDENSNGKWEGPLHSDSESYGYRLRQQQLEMQRGVEHCDGSGWERLSDPAFLRIDAFQVRQQGRLFNILLSGRAGSQQVSLESWIEGENL
ncbi:prepilin peptidase-dependent protein [[Erwinia] mediterraneensis]|uniref:prepilin peptidase-dependent protein n=1 Tax=[Erwinia] mediterraneensis TaxID=2161819 RepID=UPI001031F335|nr:prepilin peptidase-dependent protein [[Erwinia] mediterraneensis]